MVKNIDFNDENHDNYDASDNYDEDSE